MGLPLKKIRDKARPKVLPGFENITSYWDSTHQYYSARIKPGELYVSCGEEIITTVLGSCVSACIRDTQKGIGGMNHFMLPDTGTGSVTNASLRYGNYAMEHLINSIMSNGGSRHSLEVKLFGGGRVLSTDNNIGQKNICFVRDYLKEEGVLVASEDMGGINPRKIIYFPFSGKALVKKLPIEEKNTVSSVEANYLESIKQKPVSGEIDLF